MNLGVGEIAVILITALLLFGPSKLPKLGKAAGQALAEFKSGLREIVDIEKEETPPKKRKRGQTTFIVVTP